MSRSLLIVGAGPAAAGAALAAVGHGRVDITVLDIGGRLEPRNERARERLAASEPSDWSSEDLEIVASQPVDSDARGLPEKRTFGSDFPFRDVGQLRGLFGRDGTHARLVSGAYGGFSNTWGAQVMPFTREALRDWPVPVDEMYRHYSRVLAAIPFAAEHDDLDELFPLLHPESPLPPVAARTEYALARYARIRDRLRSQGVTLGRARLAMDAARCIRCGLCMTGCPYGLIYSASQTLDALRAKGRITYRDGLRAVKVEEGPDTATVIARDTADGQIHRFNADRVFIACGGIGSSRLVMGSLGLHDSAINVAESAQFVLPFVSARPAPSPLTAHDFTLNQFNMVIDLDGRGYDLSQLHFYTFNHSFLEALPSALRRRRFSRPRSEMLRRLTVALGYLPSWVSPSFTVRTKWAGENELPELEVSRGPSNPRRNPMLRRVLSRVVAAAPGLDLWPVLPALQLPASGKSYHWGATFPHRATPTDRYSSDPLGRVAPWTRVHLIDAAVFPNVPATTFTLTVMANAHRIAESALELRG